MRFDQVQIRLEPLSASNCLDLAVLFAGRYIKPVMQLTFAFAVPCCAAVYLLSYYDELELDFAALLLYFATAPLGVWLVTGAAAASFGEPFLWSSVARGRWMMIVRMCGWSLLLRALIGSTLGVLFFAEWSSSVRIVVTIGLVLFPGIWLALRNGFFVERRVLGRLSHHLHETRGSKLMRKRSSDLFGSALLIIIFCVLLWCVLFIACDLLMYFLFQIPVFIPRIGPDGDLWFLLGGDPKVLTLMMFCGFLVYPIGRLAWFFTYIDLRVRRDCWDMELQLLGEAQRLEGQA